MRSVFISSTFKDMQSERDLLHERIFPRLRRVMAEYGEDIQELDLRWGVDTADMTEEESGHAVLKVCIDAIDRCKPFFIVLLGERYGWIPGEEIVTSVGDDRISGYYEPGMSITNLEIAYGALAKEELLERCIFCFRDPSLNERIGAEYRGIYDAESVRHREKLAALKDTVLKKGRGEILRYHADWDSETHRVTGLDGFGEQVYRILERMIRREFAGQRPSGGEERLLREAAQTKERYLSSYIPRPAEELAVLEGCASFGMAQSGERKRIWVKGEAGTGKSALMAACARAMEDNGWHTILYFSGNPGCQDLSVLKQVLAWRMEEILGEPHERHGESPEERLKFLDEKITAQQRIFCFLDAADQLFGEGTDTYLDVLQFCPHLFFVISALPSFSFEEAVTGTGISFDTVHVYGLKKRQIRQMIAATAKRRGKKLDDVVSEAVLGKQESGNPLYLSMILQRFFMMDGPEFAAAEALAPGMEGLHRYMMNLLGQMPEDAAGMARYLLTETAGHFGISNFTTIVSLLVASREGLSEQELEGILADTEYAFSPVEFQQVVSYLYDAFAQRQDGKWSFSHRLFGEAVREDFADFRTSEAEELLIAYARDNREFRQREGYYYLLAGKCPEGARILECAAENAKAVPSADAGRGGRPEDAAEAGGDRKAGNTGQAERYDTEELYRIVSALLYRDPDYGRYLIQMAEQSGQPDRLAMFWSENYFVSSSHKEYEVQHHIWDSLLENPACSARGKLACCKKYISSCITEGNYVGAERYLDRASWLIEEIPAEEKEYEQISHLAERGDHAGRMEDPAQACQFYRRAVGLSAAAEQTERVKELRMRLFRSLYESGGQTEDGVSGERLLLAALEETEGCGCSSLESVLISEKIRTLGQLTRLYVSEEKFDIEKAKAYGEEGIALARACAQQSPSALRLLLLAQMLTDAAALKNGGYQYPYFKEAVECRKRIFGNLKTTDNQLFLAYTYTRYAQSLDQAIDARVKKRPQDAAEQAKENWDAGFAVFEEMLSGPAAYVAALNYRERLYAKAQIALNRREYEEAVRYAGRVLELLPGKAEDSDADAANVRQEKHTGQPDSRFDGIGSEELQMKNKAGRILVEAHIAMLREEEILSLARETLEQGRALKERQPSAYAEHAVLTSALLLARALYRQASFEEAFPVCQEAEEACGRLVEQGYSYRAAREELAYMQGRICYEQGKYEEASSYYKTAKQFDQQVKQWTKPDDMFLKHDLTLLEMDLILKTEQTVSLFTLSRPRSAVNLLERQWNVHGFTRDPGERYLLVRLDIFECYAWIQKGREVQKSGGLQSWDEDVDVVDGKLAFVEQKSGGEREYCIAYLRCRKWLGQFPRIRRLAMPAFEQMCVLCSAASEERMIWTAAELARGIAKEGTELFSWEQDFFRGLLATHDLSAIGNADFWHGMAYSMGVCDVEAVREENRAGIGEACFLNGDFKRAKQWFSQAPGVSEGLQSPVWRMDVLAGEELRLSGGKLPAESREQIGELLQTLSDSRGSVRETCQRAACHELLAAVTEGDAQAGHIRDIFAEAHPFMKRSHERQLLRVLRRHAPAIILSAYGKEKASEMAKELSEAAENGEENGYFSDAAEEVGTFVLLEHVLVRWWKELSGEEAEQGQEAERSDRAARPETAAEGSDRAARPEAAAEGSDRAARPEAEKEIDRCLETLWRLLSSDPALWSLCCGTLSDDDLRHLLGWWTGKKEAEPAAWTFGESSDSQLSGWRFMQCLSSELYERTGERKWLLAFPQEGRKYLAKQSPVSIYARTKEEQRQYWRNSRQLAQEIWEWMRAQIGKNLQAESADQDGSAEAADRVCAGRAAEDGAAFWAEAAVAELREGMFGDCMSKKEFMEAGIFIGERYPQYREEIREIYHGQDRCRLEHFLTGLRCPYV